MNKCYISESFGLCHYYKQIKEGVVHINPENKLVNLLDTDYLSSGDKLMMEIEEKEFDNIFYEVLNYYFSN